MTNKLRRAMTSRYAATAYLAIALCAVIELLGRSSPLDSLRYLALSPHLFLLNVLIVFCTLAVGLLFRRRVFVWSLVSVLWLALGVTNCVLIHLRGNPLTAVDFTIIGDAIAVVPTYLSPFAIVGILLLLAGAVAGLVVLFLRGPRFEVRPLPALTTLLTSALLIAVLCPLYLHIGAISRKFDDLIEGYSREGFAYCFALSAFDTGIDRPTEYSQKSVSELLAQLTPKVDTPELLPNIVFYQMESFVDPTRIAGLSFSRDPVPNFRRLREENTGGRLMVSTIGGGTANTEFEILTGLDLDLFGLGEYPYKTVLQDKTCETVCYDLAELGYRSHALHNFTGTFYSRNEVFNQLGFDTFTSLEYFPGVIETTPAGWPRDDMLRDEILRTLDSTSSPDFIYTITVEGHGPYPDDIAFPDGDITVEGAGEQTALFEYYVNMLADTDAALGRLTEALSALDEPTVLVVYGDHLPALSLTDATVEGGSVYASEYLIWANYDLDLPADRDLEAYQLSAHLLGALDIEGGVLTRLHNRLYERTNYHDALQIAGYDVLYGDCITCGGAPPARETPMQMGLYPVTISGAYQQDGRLHVTGENFTAASVIRLGVQRIQTEYIDTGHISCDIAGQSLPAEISVIQLCDGLTVLSETEPFPLERTDS